MGILAIASGGSSFYTLSYSAVIVTTAQRNTTEADMLSMVAFIHSSIAVSSFCQLVERDGLAGGPSGSLQWPRLG